MVVVSFFLSLGIVNIRYEYKFDAGVTTLIRSISMLLRLVIAALFTILILYSGLLKCYSQANYWLVFWKMTYGAMILFIIQEAQFAWHRAETSKMEFINAQVEFKLSQLRQQVDPHFLFNSLNILRAMVAEADENTEKYIISLSKFYRQMLGSDKLAITTLNEELIFLKSYTYLLETRFENSFHLEIDIPQEAEWQKIPTFSLQILIENCIKHNALSKTNPLNIKIFQSCADTITVANDFRPMSSKNTSNRIGLQNLINRYSLLNIQEGIMITQTEHSFLATLKLIQA
jgi:LytS/YehU family sensor histidine kinase